MMQKMEVTVTWAQMEQTGPMVKLEWTVDSSTAIRILMMVVPEVPTLWTVRSGQWRRWRFTNLSDVTTGGWGYIVGRQDQPEGSDGLGATTVLALGFM